MFSPEILPNNQEYNHMQISMIFTDLSGVWKHSDEHITSRHLNANILHEDPARSILILNHFGFATSKPLHWCPFFSLYQRFLRGSLFLAPLDPRSHNKQISF